MRKVLADGTVKEYHYGAWKPAREKAPRYTQDSVDGLLAAFRRSPEFTGKAKNTQANYTVYLRVWDKMGQVAVKDVTRRTILTLRDGVHTASGPGAANAFVAITRTLFSWAVDHDWREHNPASNIKGLPAGHWQAWTGEQADKAEAELPAHIARIVLLARYTGQRRGDLCRMTWAAYDGTSIRLRQGKTKRGTQAPLLVIPCHPRLKAALDQWKATRGDAVTILTNHYGRPWTEGTMSHMMHDAMESIGLAGLNVHGLRKLAAATLADAGCTSHEIQAITGHRTLAMVELYTRSANQERLAGQAIAKLQPRTTKN